MPKAKPVEIVSPAHWTMTDIEMVPIEKLTPYAKNAREHSSVQVDQLAASMTEYGWTVPCLIDDGGPNA